MIKVTSIDVNYERITIDGILPLGKVHITSNKSIRAAVNTYISWLKVDLFKTRRVKNV